MIHVARTARMAVNATNFSHSFLLSLLFDGCTLPAPPVVPSWYISSFCCIVFSFYSKHKCLNF